MSDISGPVGSNPQQMSHGRTIPVILGGSKQQKQPSTKKLPNYRRSSQPLRPARNPYGSPDKTKSKKLFKKKNYRPQPKIEELELETQEIEEEVHDLDLRNL